MKARWASSSPAGKRKHQELVKVNQKRYRQQIAELVTKFREHGCRFCPEKATCCLSAHHLDPAKKDFSISQAGNKGASLEKVVAELEKCICVCHNCHAKIHAGLISAASPGDTTVS